MYELWHIKNIATSKTENIKEPEPSITPGVLHLTEEKQR